ncbi:MAG TPA: efflux RND transporter periplasmic adaptor subunit [Candidatus Acidoferrales bacterium]|nr:efflux RND transporter periplasmic adaptor subunit [Candidatus Acidoferrales bacterium]
MKRKWKVIIFVVVVLILAIGVYASTVLSKKGLVTVQTGNVVRGDLDSIVTASGEIKPKNYINIGANAQGELKEILVKEGDRVRKGQVLARIENVQPEADVEAQRATLNAAEADSAASEAQVKAQDENIRTMQSQIEKDKADLDRMKADYDRSEALFKEHLLAKQDFDLRKFSYEAQLATIKQSEQRLVQARAQREQAAAQLAGAQKRIAQYKAVLVRFNDILQKFNAYAPIDGVITNLPVRTGEIVVPGVQNSAASTIMTIADMSLITAEVKVDETDIVNVKLNQTADVTIDAIPNKTFKGHVTEIGNTAILRSTGLAASQSAVSSQEAKDFKVVVALDNPPDDIRPGLSCTAKITTATRKNVLTIPIQALTVRQKGQLEPKPADPKAAPVVTKLDPAAEKAKKEEVQGVFVVNGGKAVFKKVETGITGATDIEVLNGLKEGDQIVTGTYQVIRTIANEAQVKVDNKAPAAAAAKS